MGSSPKEYPTVKITVLKDLPGLERQIKNLVKIDMKQIGLKTLELNFDQIEKQQNNDGSKFKPYSQEYADRKGVGKTNVDLTSKASALSPSQKKKPYATMLKNYKLRKLQRYSVEVGFTSVWDRQKAMWVINSTNNKSKARPFVGLNRKNTRKVYKFAYKQLTKGVF